MGQSSQQQQQTQQSQSSPWGPTQPLLGSIIGRMGGFNTDPTGAQQTALGNMWNTASGIPNFGGMAGGLAANLLGGGGGAPSNPYMTSDPGPGGGGGNPYMVPSGGGGGGLPNFNSGLLGNLQGLHNTLDPYTQPGFTNPFTNPNLSPALNTIANDVTKNVNGQFAAAGRDLSPANSRAVARGVMEGQAPTVANEFNTLSGLQQGAANSLFGAGTQTNAGLLGNAFGGLAAAGAIPGLSMAGPMEQMKAAQAGYGLPFSNLGSLESMLLPIAGLGGQFSGQGNSSTTYNPSPLTMGLQGLQGLGMLFG